MRHGNPTLFHASSSYYSMVARYALCLSQISYDSRLLDIHHKREQLHDWYVAINPSMTVPALQAADRTYDSSSAIVRFAQATAPEYWFESNALPSDLDNIDRLVQRHDAFEVERLTFNALMQKLPPLRLAFPHLLRKVCRQLREEVEQGAPHMDAIKAKLAVNEARLEYFAGEPLAKRQQRQIELARTFIQAFGQCPSGSWLFGQSPSHADVVLVVFLARLRMVGLLDAVGVPGAFVQWLEQKTQTSAFEDADVWVKLKPMRLLLHR